MFANNFISNLDILISNMDHFQNIVWIDFIKANGNSISGNLLSLDKPVDSYRLKGVGVRNSMVMKL